MFARRGKTNLDSLAQGEGMASDVAAEMSSRLRSTSTAPQSRLNRLNGVSASVGSVC
jgi:hypothetical protein